MSGQLEAVYLPPGVKTRYVSDGYHTFDELYDHRMALTAALCAMGPKSCWRSKRHHPDGEPMFDGFFIVGLDLHDVGVVTYHYKLEHWDKSPAFQRSSTPQPGTATSRMTSSIG